MPNKISKLEWLLLAIFIIGCYAVSYIGAIFTPGEWYESLNRAPWSPPNIAFPIVWSILYLFIAIAGWMIFRKDDDILKMLWLIQLILNAGWSWLFFGEHWVGLAEIDLILLVFVVSALCLLCWRQQLKVATFLLLPYLLWLGVATSLNTYILIAN